jgi:signal transduction histidine kinase
MALRNLLANAVAASPDGVPVEIGISEEQSEWLLWVRDEGKGIREEEVPYIFDRFYRSSENTSAGSGLGLAIVKSVAEAHGGSVEVESRHGGGSRFVIRIPRHRR